MDAIAIGGKVSVKKNKDYRRSNRKCCVVGCPNTEPKNPELHFYRFPSRSYEAERKMKWLIAARRGSETNKNEMWMPTENSRICSVHFEGGEKSNDPRKTSYNPTIFPKIHEKPQSKLKRKRLKVRNQKEAEPDISDFLEILTNNDMSNDQDNADIISEEADVQTT